METLGDRLKILRGNISQATLADRLGIPQTTWSNYEKNKNKPDFALIDQLCIEFKVGADWLLFGRGPEPQEVGGIPSSHEEGRLAALEDERRELSAENRQLWKENAALRERVARLEAQVTLSEVLKGGAMDTAVPASAPSAPSTNPNNDRA